MMNTAVGATVLATLLGPAQGADPNPCRLLTPAEITSALGRAPSGATPAGPSTDRDLRATSWGCDRQVGELYLSIEVIGFPSPASAADGMTLATKELKDEDWNWSELPAVQGLGERAVWAVSADGGAMWTVLKGKYIFALVLAGELTDPSRLREPLQRLATLALGRL